MGPEPSRSRAERKLWILRKVDCNRKWESSTEEASVSGRDASKVQQWSTMVKKRMSQNEGSSDQCIGGYNENPPFFQRQKGYKFSGVFGFKRENFVRQRASKNEE
ncbi:unnamed protein product [Sphenostylis stenocarpa]|uniref:Uncharacterized protein n=1 Tax=Sphenostylis stenocarpa TaxID=92480 RepID=A0AA86VBA0_9FABA|nr:unnamed protein product [Sphenostylis stenocarpa]